MALLVEFAQVFLRRGQPVIARDLIDRAATLAPGDPLVDDVRRRAQDDLRVHDGSWVRPHPRRRVERQPGRVLHLVSASLPHHTSGGTYRTHHIARAQRDLGLDPQVVTPLGFPWGDGVVGAREADVLDGIEYIRIPDDDPADAALPERMGRNLDRLVPLVEALRPAVLHPASDYLNALLALELRKLFDIPVVYEVRGFPEERQVRRGGSRACSDQGVGRRAMELGCMHAADRIVTLAEVMKRHIVSRGVPAEKIHIVPNGVDLDALRPVPRDRALAARLGIEDDETVLGYVSTFHGYEGIQFIVRAVAELIGRGRRVRALLVGDGREREPLERLAAELGIGGAVVFTGRVPHDEVLRYYSLIDLFVVPRRAEATSELVTPLKPYEAMAAERPVIVVGRRRAAGDDPRRGDRTPLPAGGPRSPRRRGGRAHRRPGRPPPPRRRRPRMGDRRARVEQGRRRLSDPLRGARRRLTDRRHGASTASGRRTGVNVELSIRPDRRSSPVLAAASSTATQGWRASAGCDSAASSERSISSGPASSGRQLAGRSTSSKCEVTLAS